MQSLHIRQFHSEAPEQQAFGINLQLEFTYTYVHTNNSTYPIILNPCNPNAVTNRFSIFRLYGYVLTLPTVEAHLDLAIIIQNHLFAYTKLIQIRNEPSLINSCMIVLQKLQPLRQIQASFQQNNWKPKWIVIVESIVKLNEFNRQKPILRKNEWVH